MGAVESGTDEGKNDNLVTKGRSEIEQGLAQIKGKAVPASGETGETAEGTGTHASEAAKLEDKQQPTATSSTSQPTTGAVPSQLPTSGTTTQAEGAVGADVPKSQQNVLDTGQKQGGQNYPEREQTQPGSCLVFMVHAYQTNIYLASPTKSPQMGLVGEGADAPQGPGSSV